jgi:transcriptional regulator with XRE-family HTH domain
LAVRRDISRHEEVRRRAGYLVTGLAEALEVSHAYVSQVEGGLTKPSARYRKAFCDLLGIAEELVFPDEEER